MPMCPVVASRATRKKARSVERCPMNTSWNWVTTLGMETIDGKDERQWRRIDIDAAVDLQSSQACIGSLIALLAMPCTQTVTCEWYTIVYLVRGRPFIHYAHPYSHKKVQSGNIINFRFQLLFK